MPLLKTCRGCFYPCILSVCVVFAMGAISAADEVAELCAILQSDAPLHDRGVACQRLAVVGSAESIPVLATLLGDAELSHLARAALEAIPSPQVDSLFRQQLSTASGDQLIGIIDSIGNRRDTAAVESLALLLPQATGATQAAALSALGTIASPESAEILLTLLKTSANLQGNAGSNATLANAVADAALRCADRFAVEGKTAEALKVYDAVRAAPVSPTLLAAATLSTIRVSGSTGLALLNDQLASSNDDHFAVGLQAASRMPTRDVVGVLVRALPNATPQRAVMLLDALADLGDTSVLPAVREAVGSEHPGVKAAAISALGKVGDAAVLELLLAASGSDNAAVASAAQRSLAELHGEGVDQAILDTLQRTTAHQETLLRLIGARRMNALPVLWAAMKTSELPVRLAALDSLGRTIPDSDLLSLVDVVLNTTGEEHAAAIAALTSACRRASDPDETVRQISARFAAAPLELQRERFDVLKTIGGEEALRQVIRGAMDPEEPLQDAATRALGEWPTPDVGPELLPLCHSLQTPKFKIRALRAYVRVFKQFGLPSEERLQMAREAFALATRPEDKVLILHALLSFQNLESMQFALEHIKDPGLEATAAQVAIYISEQVSDKKAVIEAMRMILDSGAEETYAKQARDILAKNGALGQ